MSEAAGWEPGPPEVHQAAKSKIVFLDYLKRPGSPANADLLGVVRMGSVGWAAYLGGFA
jgi:hypothetical protein